MARYGNVNCYGVSKLLKGDVKTMKQKIQRADKIKVGDKIVLGKELYTVVKVTPMQYSHNVEQVLIFTDKKRDFMVAPGSRFLVE